MAPATCIAPTWRCWCTGLCRGGSRPSCPPATCRTALARCSSRSTRTPSRPPWSQTTVRPPHRACFAAPALQLWRHVTLTQSLRIRARSAVCTCQASALMAGTLMCIGTAASNCRRQLGGVWRFMINHCKRTFSLVPSTDRQPGGQLDDRGGASAAGGYLRRAADDAGAGPGTAGGDR
jgi:hypothetical protein